jgi:uncharacterized protein (TIGR02453 family)
VAGSPFTKKTLAFLRALEAEQRREWFRARKADYEQHVREPMVALLGRLARDLPRSRPTSCRIHACACSASIATRASAATSGRSRRTWPPISRPKFPKGEGAGLYVEVAPGWVWAGGGIYMPSSTELRAVRARIGEDHRRFHPCRHGGGVPAAVGDLGGEQLTRVPRGYPKDHRGRDYLRHTQFIGGREYPADFAVSRASTLSCCPCSVASHRSSAFSTAQSSRRVRRNRGTQGRSNASTP